MRALRGALPAALALWFLLWFLYGSPVRAEQTVAGFALASRQHAAATARVDRIVAELSRALGAKVVPRATPAPPGLDEAAFARAEKLYQQVSFDAAAAISDQILENAARNPDRVIDGARLESLLLQRASLALARAEVHRADELLLRLLRNDPDVTLRQVEADPALERELQAVRRRLEARAPIAVSQVGDGCQIADVVVVARVRGLELELQRFDQCRPTAEAIVGAQVADATIAGMLQRSASAEPTPSLPADAAARALDRFEVGAGLYRIGKYEEAIREFTAGYALSSKPAFLLNIGLAYRKLNDLAHAREIYQTFLAQAPPDAPERPEVRRLVVEIDQALAAKQPAPAPRDGIHALAPSPPTRSRAMLAGGVATIGIGVIAIALGGAFAGLARNTSADAARAGSTFNPADEDRLHLYQALDATFFSIGGVALAAGVGLTIGGARR
jgi:tetratricopeptide (TPR) repeat protein